MRQLEMSQDASSHQTYTTPRTLLSLIRLSMALAKLRYRSLFLSFPLSRSLTHCFFSCRFDNQVIRGDVDEAIRLMRMSKASLDSDSEPHRREDNVSICYKLIREEAHRMVSTQAGAEEIAIPLSRIMEITSKFNLTREDVLKCIKEYAEIAVWTAVDDRDGNPVVHLAAEDIVMQG